MLLKDWAIRGIKLIDICFMTTIYFLLGFLCSRGIDRLQGNKTEEQQKKEPRWQLLLEIILVLWCSSVSMYIIKNLVELIPFPLDGVCGFKHSRTVQSEYAGISVFSFALFYFQKKLPLKMNIIYNTVFYKDIAKSV